MNNKHTKESLMAFINTSTSPYHVVNKAEVILRDGSFEELNLADEWHLKEGNSYMVNIYGTGLIAFKIGNDMRKNLRIAAAHTDFPNIRIKPNPIIKKEGYLSFNVEMYGGLIDYTWFDRPLSIAGKVVLRGQDVFRPETVLVDFKEPIAIIPSLAIHMDHTVNKGAKFNRQTQMLPLVGQIEQAVNESLNQCDFDDKLAKHIGCDKKDILFFDLGLYPTNPACTVGFDEEFISAPRLDNLTSVKACLEGLTYDISNQGLHIIALFDNEEVGSCTKQGADSMILPQILQRIYLSMGYKLEECYEDIARGFMLSIDVAHGYHPNYSDKNDVTNKPTLNGGVVIKYASSQKYAGDADAVSIVKALCEDNNIDYQIYVNRSDISGGSTLGSMLSALVPMRTMDVGVPLLAMHSARELMGASDQTSLEELILAIFTS